MATTAVQDDRVTITLQDLNKHNTKTDCWIAVHSKVWDITDFINEHPGGPGGTSPRPRTPRPSQKGEGRLRSTDN